MTPPQFDGPRLLRRDELRASRWLDWVAFAQFSGALEDVPVRADELDGPDIDRTHVITCDGLPVSQILIFQTQIKLYEAITQVGSVGGVCTHPDYRGYGLAGQLLAHCAGQLVLGGARLMLISGERGLYTRLGNVRTGHYAGFNLTPGMLRVVEGPVTLRPALPEDGPACARMHQAEPVRFERPAANFDGFLARSEKPEFFHVEKFILETEGRPAAYLFLNRSWADMHQPETTRREVFEYAGSRAALAAGLAQLMNAGEISGLRLTVPWQDTDLITLLRGLGGADAPTPLPDHTLRIINFPGLMRDLEPYLAARLNPELRRGLRFEQRGPLLGWAGDQTVVGVESAGSGESAGSVEKVGAGPVKHPRPAGDPSPPGDVLAIARGDERLELDGAAMTALVMGDPRGAYLGELKLTGALAEICSALFPLPSFLPGLDYH